MGYVIKLLAIAKDAGSPIESRAPRRSCGASCWRRWELQRGLRARRRGQAGALTGSAPAACHRSAVVGDVMEMARRIKAGAGARAPAVAGRDARILPMDEVACPCYVRIRPGQAGVLAAVAGSSPATDQHRERDQKAAKAGGADRADDPRGEGGGRERARGG
jgi:hypothetical protein